MGFVGDFYGLQLAVGNDGTIYFKIWYEDWIQAVNPDGTGKWNHHAESELETSITIGNDGIIYYGYNTGRVKNNPVKITKEMELNILKGRL